MGTARGRPARRRRQRRNGLTRSVWQGESEALHGCIPILVTPFADDGSLDLESLEREIDWVLAEGASGVACVAIASEGYKLTETERDAVIATTVRRIDGRAPVVASADGPGEEPAIDRARRAAAARAPTP